ncbi:hypothetical protein ABZ923_14120 [Streptomyces sp. NPDC046881]|uniref:hypothetical protein n=1 Tax=Streptomyces sp. NPDC046881 TaxID=3155374 RepID=UPI0033C150DD
MNTLVSAPPLLPDVARLRPRQQMGIECADCGLPLGPSGRVLGEVRYRGLPFRLWVCPTGCDTTPPASGP